MNRFTELNVVKKCETILKQYEVRYKKEASIGPGSRIDIFLLDANIGVECKGFGDSSKNGTQKQVERYLTFIPDVWLVVPNDRSLTWLKKIGSKSMNLFGFECNIRELKKTRI